LKDSKAEVLLSRERSGGGGQGAGGRDGNKDLLATLEAACGVDMFEELNPPPLPLVSSASSPSGCSFSSSALLMNPPPLPLSSCSSPQRRPAGGDHVSTEVCVCVFVCVCVCVCVCVA
jgi:hypothetical protein